MGKEKAKDERNEAIWAAVESGQKRRLVAAEHGVSIARIVQIHARIARKKRGEGQFAAQQD